MIVEDIQSVDESKQDKVETKWPVKRSMFYFMIKKEEIIIMTKLL